MIQIDIELPCDCSSCPFSKIEEIPVNDFGFGIYKKYFMCQLTGETDELLNGTRNRMKQCPMKEVILP